MRNPETETPGFTIAEVVIVIAILAVMAALFTPLAVNMVEQKRFDVCQEELVNFKKAIVGDPALIEGGTRNSFGFVGDMGALPGTLAQLTDSTGLSLWPQVSNGVTWGWRGPYISELTDPWGITYQYSTTGLPAYVAARIWTFGPNHINESGANGNPVGGDDLFIDIRTDDAFSMVGGNTMDQCGAGKGFTVNVYGPNGGVVGPLTTTAASPYFPASGTMPIGIRRIVFSEGATTYDKYIYVNNGPITIVNFREPGVCTN